MKKPVAVFILIISGTVGTQCSQAGIIFSEDFESESSSGLANYNNFLNWNVERGFVDLVGPSFFGTLISNTQGRAVDLDGSSTGPTIAPGKLETKQTILFDPGLYEFRVDIANPSGFGQNQMKVTIGNLFQETYSRPNSPASLFQTEIRQFSVTSQFSATIIFDELEPLADTGGLFIDNIEIEQLSAIPEPSSLTLLGLGAISLIGYGWRRKRKPAA